MRIFVFLLFATACAAALAAPPRKLTLHYDMSRNGSSLAEVVETLEHDGKIYAITSETTGKGLLAALGVVKRTSRGRITPQGLQPDEFRDQRAERPPTVARFDWTKRTVTQERNGKSETLDMPAFVQDTLSMAYTFAFVPPAGKEVQVTRADGRGITPFRFAVLGTEKLATPAGEMQALHISKQRDGPDDKATDIWFASGRNYLPVRVLIVEKDGTRMDQMITRMPD